MDQKIVLASIIKGTDDEPIKLKRLLSSVAPFVDAIYITITGDKNKTLEAQKICEEYKANISYFQPISKITPEIREWVKKNLNYDPHVQVDDKIFNFDQARNFNFSQVSPEYEWILWMDCDDVLKGGDNLKEVVKKGQENHANIIMLDYLYHVEVDEQLNIQKIIIQHVRERVVRNGKFKWHGVIHEIMPYTKESNPRYLPDCQVMHVTSQEARIASLQRNVKALEYAIYKTQGKDSRYTYYLAKAFYDMHQEVYDIRAQELMFKYLLGENQSVWQEERSQAWMYIAEIYRRHQEFDNSMKALFNGLLDDNFNREIYFDLAISSMGKKQWQQALNWLFIAQAIPKRATLLAQNPRDEELKILEISYNCYYNLGMYKETREIASKIIEIFPEDPILKTNLNRIA